MAEFRTKFTTRFAVKFTAIPLGLLLVSAALGLGFGAYHRTPLTEPNDTNTVPSSLVLSNAPLRRVSEGVYELGLVQFDKNKRTITFPCAVNMADGVVEYALVHSTGKVHESVLKTEANPAHLHLAWLLLQPVGRAEGVTDPRVPRELRGPRVGLWAQWTLSGVEKRVPLEDLVSNTMTKSRMSRGPWIYNGSRVVQGAFLAERDGSIVSVIADPDALMNSPRPGRDDDEIWTVNSSLTPAVGTKVQVTIDLAEYQER